MTFQVGDHVVVINPESSFSNLVGQVDEFEPNKEMSYGVKFSDRPYRVYFGPGEIQGVVGDYSDWPDDAQKQEVDPSYYDFPQGIEVRHISAHLTSFGGQALQYVARATRLDGRNKGNPIEDLTKALDFIQWEIDRLRGLE